MGRDKRSNAPNDHNGSTPDPEIHMTKEIKFSNYAEFQLKQRNINREDAVKALKFPDQVVPGKKGRKIAQKKFAKGELDGLLRVIYEEKANIISVITIYPVRECLASLQIATGPAFLHETPACLSEIQSMGRALTGFIGHQK